MGKCHGVVWLGVVWYDWGEGGFRVWGMVEGMFARPLEGCFRFGRRMMHMVDLGCWELI